MNRVQKDRKIKDLKFRISNYQKALFCISPVEVQPILIQLNKLKQELKDIQESIK